MEACIHARLTLSPERPRLQREVEELTKRITPYISTTADELGVISPAGTATNAGENSPVDPLLVSLAAQFDSSPPLPPSLPASPPSFAVAIEAPQFLPKGGHFTGTTMVNIFADTPG
jgi:hypothetical protein